MTVSRYPPLRMGPPVHEIELRIWLSLTPGDSYEEVGACLQVPLGLKGYFGCR
jgi:hypothetical protein